MGVAILGLLLKAPSPSVVTLSGRGECRQAAVGESTIAEGRHTGAQCQGRQFGAAVESARTDRFDRLGDGDGRDRSTACEHFGRDGRCRTEGNGREFGTVAEALSPSVVAEIFAEVRPVPANASVPMFSIADRLVSTSALHPLNALSPTVLTLDGRVRDASAVHPSNVLSPMISTPVGTVALVRAVQPLKAPAAIEAVFSKNLIVPSFALPANPDGEFRCFEFRHVQDRASRERTVPRFW